MDSEYTTITGISDHGTIVAVHLADHPRPIYFDHRSFNWLLGARSWLNIIGARVRRVTDDNDEGESIVFEDEEFEEDGFVVLPDELGDQEPTCWGFTSYEHYKGDCKHFAFDDAREEDYRDARQ